MGTLSGAINASVKLITVSGMAAPAPNTLLKIDTELVAFRAVAQTDTADRAPIPGTWIVGRGQAETTAASHSDGATVTEYVPVFGETPFDQAGGGEGGSGWGAPTLLTIVDGAIDVTGLRYVLLDGEGDADDTLTTINGGVDGQEVLIEEGPAGNAIIVGQSADNLEAADQETSVYTLGEFVTQLRAVYSASRAKWQVWADHVAAGIMSRDGATEIQLTNLTMIAQVEGDEAFYADATEFRITARPLRIDSYYLTRHHSAPADSDLAEGDLTFWFDQTDGAAKLMVKAKTADGTVVTGSVNLA